MPLLASLENVAAVLPTAKAVATLLLPAPASTVLLLPSAAAMRELPITRQRDRVGRIATAAVAAAAAAARHPPSNTLLPAGITIETAALAAAADATVAAAGNSRIAHTRNLLSDASLTDSTPTVTVSEATPEAANTGTVTIYAPRADTVSKVHNWTPWIHPALIMQCP